MTETIFPVITLLIGLAIGVFAARMFNRATAGNSGDDSARVADLQKQAQDAREDAVRAETNLKNLQAQFDLEKARLEEIRAEMENAFKAMAADIATANSRAFLEQADEKFKHLAAKSEQQLDTKKKMIDTTLSGMNQNLEMIKKQSSELKTSLEKSHETTETLSEHTQHLREVLSSSQKRGQWGERMVTDILQVIGMLEGKNYTRQSKVESGERPDFTFLLPLGKKLNMDAKFPFDNYVRHIETGGEAGEAAKKTFFRDVKKHISDVSGRAYINPAEGTLEYVMLFIPNESIYGFINSEDTELVDYALQNRVLLCSPLTLYAVLSLVHQATRNFTMNERASEVMNLVGQFQAQWKKYVEQMDKLGRRIDGLSGDYHDLVNARTRGLQRPLDKIENISLASLSAGEDAPLLESPPREL